MTSHCCGRSVSSALSSHGVLPTIRFFGSIPRPQVKWERIVIVINDNTPWIGNGQRTSDFACLSSEFPLSNCFLLLCLCESIHRPTITSWDASLRNQNEWLLQVAHPPSVVVVVTKCPMLRRQPGKVTKVEEKTVWAGQWWWWSKNCRSTEYHRHLAPPSPVL